MYRSSSAYRVPIVPLLVLERKNQRLLSAQSHRHGVKHSDAMMTPEIDDNAVGVFSASVVDSSMMTSDSDPSTMTTEAEDSLGALVSSVSETIKSGVSVAIDNVSKLSGNDVVLLARSLSWGIESLAKSTEDMVFPRQAEDKMYKKHIKHMMAYQQMAHAHYYAAMANAAQQQEEEMKKKKENRQERKMKSAFIMAQGVLRRNKSEPSEVKTEAVSDSKAASERKIVKPLQAHNR